MALWRDAKGIESMDSFQQRFYADYPAHLHIDLLAVAQGHGLGRVLLERLLAEVRKVAPAVHLVCAASNARARALYESLGFNVLLEEGGECAMGLRFQ